MEYAEPEIVGTWINEFLDDAYFYNALESAGIWYERGRIDHQEDMSYRELDLKESDIYEFTQICKKYGW